MVDMRAYLQHVADRRPIQLGLDPLYGSDNPLALIGLRGVQELSNFLERRVSACWVGVTGEVAFDDDFWPRGLAAAARGWLTPSA